MTGLERAEVRREHADDRDDAAVVGRPSHGDVDDRIGRRRPGWASAVGVGRRSVSASASGRGRRRGRRSGSAVGVGVAVGVGASASASASPSGAAVGVAVGAGVGVAVGVGVGGRHRVAGIRHERRGQALRPGDRLHEPVASRCRSCPRRCRPGRPARRSRLDAGGRRRRGDALDERVRRVAPADRVDDRPADDPQRDRTTGRREPARVDGVGRTPRGRRPPLAMSDPLAGRQDAGVGPRGLARHRRAGRRRVDDLQPERGRPDRRPGWRSRRTRPTPRRRRSGPPRGRASTSATSTGRRRRDGRDTGTTTARRAGRGRARIDPRAGRDACVTSRRAGGRASASTCAVAYAVRALTRDVSGLTLIRGDGLRSRPIRPVRTDQEQTVARAKRTARADARRKYRAEQGLDADDRPTTRLADDAPRQRPAGRPVRRGAAAIEHRHGVPPVVPPLDVRGDLARPARGSRSAPRRSGCPLLLTLGATVAVLPCTQGDGHRHALPVRRTSSRRRPSAACSWPGSSRRGRRWLLGVIVGLLAATCYSILILTVFSGGDRGAPAPGADPGRHHRGVRPVAAAWARCSPRRRPGIDASWPCRTRTAAVADGRGQGRGRQARRAGTTRTGDAPLAARDRRHAGAPRLTAQPSRRIPAWPIWRTPPGCSGPPASAATSGSGRTSRATRFTTDALALQLAIDEQQGVAADDATQPLPDVRPHRHVDHPGLVLERQEDRALGGHRVLPGDDQATDPDPARRADRRGPRWSPPRADRGPAGTASTTWRWASTPSTA